MRRRRLTAYVDRRSDGANRNRDRGDQRLELFTDRYALIREFCDRVNGLQTQERVLFLHGDGGHGKSLLLRFLARKCCYRLNSDNWEYVANLKDPEEFAANVIDPRGAEAVPRVELDLYVPDHRSPIGGPLALRRLLSTAGVRWPRFDFGWLCYLADTGQLGPGRWAEFPEEEMGFVAALADVISGTAAGALTNAVISLVAKHTDRRRAGRHLQRRIDAPKIDSIRRLLDSGALPEELARLLAEDVNDAMAQPSAPSRLVLLLDSHDAFLGQDPASSIYQLSGRELWLRRLLRELKLDHGIVAVVAGREPPAWDKAHPDPIPDRCVDLREVGNFSERDARSYLSTAASHLRCTGLDTPEMADALLDFARVDDGIHPLHLGLGVEACWTVEMARAPSVRRTWPPRPPAARRRSWSPGCFST